MKPLTILRATAVGVLLGLPLAACAQAQPSAPGQHPYYLHALSDLRAARWLIEHRPGDVFVSVHEDAAIGQIDATLHDIVQASIDDGKNIHDHMPIDAPPAPADRLRRARALVDEAFRDVNREEDDPYARGLKHRALEHIRAATHELDGAIWDVVHHQ